MACTTEGPFHKAKAYSTGLELDIYCQTLPTKESHFIFDDRYYEQTDNEAMGSPVGRMLVNASVTLKKSKP